MSLGAIFMAFKIVIKYKSHSDPSLKHSFSTKPLKVRSVIALKCKQSRSEKIGNVRSYITYNIYLSMIECPKQEEYVAFCHKGLWYRCATAGKFVLDLLSFKRVVPTQIKNAQSRISEKLP